MRLKRTDICGAEPSISIIVPAHELSQELAICLRSIEQFGSLAKEVIVVLDGPIEYQNYFQSFPISQLIIRQLDVNQGPAVARNHGAQVATGDILFFLDSDVMLKEGSLKKVLDHFSTPDCTEALIGSYDDQPYSSSPVSKFRNLLHHFTHQMAEESAMTFWGACGAIKRQFFLAMGGFDSSFQKPSVEDIDLGYRLTMQGGSVRMDKALQIKHLKKWTFSNMLRTDIFYRARPWTTLLHRYQKLGVNDLNVNYSERIAVALLGMGTIGLLSSSLFVELSLLSIASFLLLFLTKIKTYRFFSMHFKWYQMPLIILLHWSYLSSAAVGFILGTADRFFNKKNDVQLSTNHEESFALNE